MADRYGDVDLGVVHRMNVDHPSGKHVQNARAGRAIGRQADIGGGDPNPPFFSHFAHTVRGPAGFRRQRSIRSNCTRGSKALTDASTTAAASGLRAIGRRTSARMFDQRTGGDDGSVFQQNQSIGKALHLRDIVADIQNRVWTAFRAALRNRAESLPCSCDRARRGAHPSEEAGAGRAARGRARHAGARRPITPRSRDPADAQCPAVRRYRQSRISSAAPAFRARRCP